jgi:hypothetical protein
LAALWLEQRRLRAGRVYEPPTFYEANAAALERLEVSAGGASPCRFVAAAAEPAEAEAVA